MMEQKVTDIEKSLVLIQESIRNNEITNQKNHEVMLKILDNISDTKLIAKDVSYLREKFEDSLKGFGKRIGDCEKELNNIDVRLAKGSKDIEKLQKDIETNNKHKWFFASTIFLMLLGAIFRSIGFK